MKIINFVTEGEKLRNGINIINIACDIFNIKIRIPFWFTKHKKMIDFYNGDLIFGKEVFYLFIRFRLRKSPSIKFFNSIRIVKHISEKNKMVLFTEELMADMRINPKDLLLQRG